MCWVLPHSSWKQCSLLIMTSDILVSLMNSRSAQLYKKNGTFVWALDIMAIFIFSFWIGTSNIHWSSYRMNILKLLPLKLINGNIVWLLQNTGSIPDVWNSLISLPHRRKSYTLWLLKWTCPTPLKFTSFCNIQLNCEI